MARLAQAMRRTRPTAPSRIEEKRLHPTDDLLLEGEKRRAKTVALRVVVLELRPHSPDDSFQFGLRLLRGNAGRETADHPVTAGAAPFHFGVGEAERLPDVGLFAKLRAGDVKERERKLKARRHDADDGESTAVGHQFASENPRVAIEFSPPESFADHDDVVAADSAFVRANGPASNGLHA